MKETILLIFFFIFGLHAFSQNSNQLIGTWQLEKISYKNTIATNDGEQQQFLNVLKASLYNQLSEEQRLDLYELEQLNEQADVILKLFYKSSIEFQANRAFYNRSQMLEQPTSGEYLLDGKKLLMEWETAEQNNFKILKINTNELLLKDSALKIIYHYIKLNQIEIDKAAAKLKKEKELGCTIPDNNKIVAQKAAENKQKLKN